MWCGKGCGNLITVAIFFLHNKQCTQDIGDDRVPKQPSSALQVSAFCERFSTSRPFICEVKYRYIYFEFYQSNLWHVLSFSSARLFEDLRSVRTTTRARGVQCPKRVQATRKSCQFENELSDLDGKES